jgi:hypothetical protein
MSESMSETFVVVDAGGETIAENPTMLLRFSKAGVLQQAWTRQVISRGSRLVAEPATVEWRNVPNEE